MMTILVPVGESGRTSAPDRATLVAAYRAAADAHQATLAGGTAVEILTAFLTALLAEVALLRHDAQPAGLGLATALADHAALLDAELAELTARAAGGVQ